MTPHSRLWILGLALVATLAAVAWVGEEEEVAAPVVRERAATDDTTPRRDARRQQKEMPTLDLARLDNRELGEPTIDLFAGKSWYVPPPPPPPPKPVAPPVPFTFIGRLIESDGMAVFVAAADRNQVLRTGSVVDGVWRVEEIEPTRMKLTYLPLKETKYFALGAAP
jgi:hypothetical protein